MVFNATFNNISVMLWQSVLLVEETGVPVENHQPATSHMLYPVHYGECTREPGAAYPSGAPEFNFGFLCGSCCSIV
jgi:hypothetical protein